MAQNKFNFVNTTQGVNVNYPSDLKLDDIHNNNKITLFIRMEEDGKTPYVSDTGSYLISNGPVYAYVEPEQMATLSFKQAKDQEPFTVLTMSLLRSANTADAKPVTIKFA